MNIAIIGLGLIGGSIAKAAKRNTSHTILGRDTDHNAILRARMLQAIDGEVQEADYGSLDMVIISLYPADGAAVLEELAPSLKAGTIVLDTCGTKVIVCERMQEICRRHGLCFIGGHPMAGIERSGFDASSETLFSHASMLMVPDPRIDISQLETAKHFFMALGFGSVKITTAAEHDRIIAYTSQLAHLVASAYIKSPTAMEHAGFSAGSFRDMTRVATLHEKMWSQLCLDNREPLLNELQRLMANLDDFRKAIEASDHEALLRLFREGRELKARVDALPPTPYSIF